MKQRKIIISRDGNWRGGLTTANLYLPNNHSHIYNVKIPKNKKNWQIMIKLGDFSIDCIESLKRQN